MNKYLIRSSFLVIMMMSLMVIPFVFGQGTTVKIVVATSNARVRAEATSGSGQVGTLAVGESAVWLGEKIDGENVGGNSLWYQIRLATGIEGWVWSGAVAIEEVIPTATPTPRPTLPPNENYQTINAENANDLRLAYQWGRGVPQIVAWSPDDTQLLVATTTGLWLHDANNPDVAERIIPFRSSGNQSNNNVLDMGFIPNTTSAYVVMITDLDQAPWRAIVLQLYNLKAGLNPRQREALTVQLDMPGFNSRGKGRYQLVAYSPQTDTFAIPNGQSIRIIRINHPNPDQNIAAFVEQDPISLTYNPSSLVFSSDGAYLAVGGNGTEIYAMSDKTLSSRSREGGSFMLFTPDSQTLLLLGSNMRFISLDATTGATNFEYNTGYAFYDAAISPDGRSFATALGLASNAISFYDTTQDAVVAEWVDLVGNTGLAYSHDGSRLASISGTRGTLSLWDVATGTQTYTDIIHYITPQADISFINDGASVVVGLGGRIVFFNPNDDEGLPLKVITNPNPEWHSFGATFNQDGSRFWASSSVFVGREIQTGLQLYDMDSNPLGDELRFETIVSGGIASSQFTAMSFSPDGQTILTGGANGGITFRNGETFEPITTVFHDFGAVMRIQYSADGEYIASLGSDNTVRVWTKTGVPVRTFTTPESTYSMQLAMNTDGSRVMVATGNEVVVWDVLAGTKLMTVDFSDSTANAEMVSYATLSPTGDLVAVAATFTGNISIFDAQTGEKLVERSANSYTRPLRFTPDGALLMGIGSDGVIYFWGVSK